MGIICILKPVNSLKWQVYQICSGEATILRHRPLIFSLHIWGYFRYELTLCNATPCLSVEIRTNVAAITMFCHRLFHFYRPVSANTCHYIINSVLFTTVMFVTSSNRFFHPGHSHCQLLAIFPSTSAACGSTSLQSWRWHRGLERGQRPHQSKFTCFG